ncbi:hypothetical protein Q9966_011424 [Columba livia]|nr:hypothetical protein Q9966_011424 [Columba livia]
MKTGISEFKLTLYTDEAKPDAALTQLKGRAKGNLVEAVADTSHCTTFISSIVPMQVVELYGTVAGLGKVPEGTAVPVLLSLSRLTKSAFPPLTIAVKPWLEWLCKTWRSRREKSLLAQLSALQSEVQLTARRYQAKFGQYMSHISSITRDLAGSQPGKGGEPKPLTIMLHRENDTLGFNIIGGRPNQKNQEESAEGIYVSKILENGPADKAEGLQIQDKIIEIEAKWFKKPEVGVILGSKPYGPVAGMRELDSAVSNSVYQLTRAEFGFTFLFCGLMPQQSCIPRDAGQSGIIFHDCLQCIYEDIMMVQKIGTISDGSQIAYCSNSQITSTIACCKVSLKRLVESFGNLNTDANI